MIVFVALTDPTRNDMDPAVRAAFPPQDSLKLFDGQWLLAANGLTTEDITRRLEAANGEKGQIAVFSITSFWGWHANNVWEWIQIKMAAT